MKVVTTADMRDLDRLTIEAGTPGVELMERAGQGAFEAIVRFARGLGQPHVRSVLLVAGKGNNGGDAHVVARLLAKQGELPASVFSVCPKDELKGEAQLNAERLPASVPFAVGDRLPDECLAPDTLIVDGLLGTGISGPVKEPYVDIIEQINRSGLPVAALDLPSGLDADTGEVANVAVRADLTVTIGLPKPGLFLAHGLELCGRLRCIDIGIPEPLIAAKPAAFDAPFHADMATLVGRLPQTVHKGQMGRIMVIGGSAAYPGAPMLCGLGALRLGGGLVSVAYPQSIGPLLRPPASALILTPVDDGGGGRHANLEASGLVPSIAAQDVLAVGPGLGREPATMAFVRDLLAQDRPVVLDADGLAVVEHFPDTFPRTAKTVLTPHPGEMARLLAALDLDPGVDRHEQARQAAAKLGAPVVLKGAGTVIAAPDGVIAVNSTGTPGLATGGSGDVLTGILAACICQIDGFLEAVKLGVFLHGLAAEQAPYGARHLIADDLPDLLGPALRQLSPHA